MQKAVEVPKGESSERIVRSMCSHCQNGCGILVRVNNGIVTQILGDPGNPRNNGLICAKGQAAAQGLYSPYRVKKPLIRTNKEKGLEIDPKWREATWDEALTLIAEKLKALRKDDPRKIMFCSFDVAGGMQEYSMFMDAFGSPNFTPASADFFCGNSVHPMHYLNQAAFEGGVDLKYCKYLLQMGTQWGSMVNQQNTMHGTTELADARAFKRTKVVVVDPWCSFAGSKADEWIPIRPGTDTAFILGIANVIINELGKYDEQYLKFRTNAPYLVAEDRTYLREKGTKKPLIWDPVESEAKPFDDESIRDYALLGEYNVDGTKVNPGFQLLKDHVKKYSPERVKEITTIPAETVRRIAKEWIENAHIGESVEVEGETIPYRPVAVNWYRGTSAHKHSASIGFAIMLLPTLVGAIDVPGGAMGENRMPWEGVTEEGLLTTRVNSVVKNPYPPRPATNPNSAFFFELFPIAPYSPVMFPLTQLNPEVYRPPYKIDMLFQLRNNIVKSSGPTTMMERWVRQLSFVVSFSTTLDETATLSDVVIPDLNHLERDGTRGLTSHPGIEGPLFEYMQHQIVRPPFDPPFDWITGMTDVLLEIADRAGFLDDFYDTFNSGYRLKEDDRLEHGKKYTWREILDRKLKTLYGQDHGIEWFQENQVFTKPKDVRSAYPGAFRKARIHLYYEFVEEARRDVERVTKELGLPWDTSDYETLPEWKPCPAFNPQSKDYDLFIINSKVPTQTLSGSIYLPALLSVTGKHKLDRGVFINGSTAARKGIKYGDWITIETESGKKARAIALVSEIVHPEVVVTFGSHGRRASGMPNTKGIGVDFNELLELDQEHIDFVNGALDSCIRVKISREA